MNKKLLILGTLTATVANTTYAQDKQSFSYCNDTEFKLSQQNADDKTIQQMCRDFAKGKDLQNIIFNESMMSFLTYVQARLGAIKFAVNAQQHNESYRTIAKNYGWALQDRYLTSIFDVLNRIIAERLAGVQSDCMFHALNANDHTIKDGGRDGTEFGANVYIPTKIKTIEDLASLTTAEYNYVLLYNIIARNIITILTNITPGKITVNNLISVEELDTTMKNLTDQVTKANEIEETKQELIKYIAIKAYQHKKVNKQNVPSWTTDKGIEESHIEDMLSDNEYAKIALEKVNKSAHDVERYIMVAGIADYITTQNLITVGMARTNFCVMKNWRSNVKAVQIDKNEILEYIRSSDGKDEYTVSPSSAKKQLKHLETTIRPDFKVVDYRVMNPGPNGEYEITKDYEQKKNQSKQYYQPDDYEKHRMGGIAIQTPMVSLIYNPYGDYRSAIVFKELEEYKGTGIGNYKIQVEDPDNNDGGLKGAVGCVQLIKTPLLALKHSLIYSTKTMNQHEFNTQVDKNQDDDLKPQTYIDYKDDAATYDDVKYKRYTCRTIDGTKKNKALETSELLKNNLVEYIQKLDDTACEYNNGNKVIRLKISSGDGKLSSDALPFGSISAYELSIAPMKHRYIYEVMNDHTAVLNSDKVATFKNVGIEYNPQVATLIASNTYEIMRSLLKDSAALQKLQEIRQAAEFQQQKKQLSETEQDALSAYMQAFEGETIDNAVTKTGDKIDNESKLLDALFSNTTK